jgi:hypothetical protein
LKISSTALAISVGLHACAVAAVIRWGGFHRGEPTVNAGDLAVSLVEPGEPATVAEQPRADMEPREPEPIQPESEDSVAQELIASSVQTPVQTPPPQLSPAVTLSSNVSSVPAPNSTPRRSSKEARGRRGGGNSSSSGAGAGPAVVFVPPR